MNKLEVMKKSLFLILIAVFFSGCTVEGDRGGNNSDVIWPEISLSLVAEGFEMPTHIKTAGDSSGRMFIVEQKGRIKVVKDNKVLKKPFLDIRERVGCCGERGLLSVAFPPTYTQKNYFYVNYTNKKGNTVISRFGLSTNPDIADSGSEEILLTIKQPFANHNGGQIVFGPDGYLYIGTGDGGFAGDPFDNGQKKDTLLGKILRIDVESGKSPYSVPADNPFLGDRRYRPEIWALGLRNPWRFSFDSRTGDIYIADVGQDRYEEVNYRPSTGWGGENYGWDIMEGNHCYSSVNCSTEGLVLPVAEYDHSQGCSVTGGMVYRGNAYPSLEGIYLYADYCSGLVRGLKRSGSLWLDTVLMESGFSVSTFGKNEDGEVFLADHDGGGIYRIEVK